MAIENKVSIKISADTSELSKAFDAARQGVANTAAELSTLGGKFGRAFDASGINAAAAALAKTREETRLTAVNAAAFTQATALLNAQVKSGAISKGEYAAALTRLRSEMGSTTTQAGKMGEGVRSISSVLGGMQNLVLGAFGTGQLLAFGQSLLAASLAADKLERTLSFASGSKTGAASEIAYLTELSQTLGVNFGDAANAYAKFAAAAKGSAMEGDGVRQGFEAVAKATTVMGLSADESNGIFLALSQMMAKGKVSAEEFRGQLGERLPIATQVAAQALGVTTAEFSKMLDSGQLVSDEFLPKFFAALDKAVGKDAQDAAQSMSAQINRLSTNWDLLKRNVADSEGLFGQVTQGLVATASDLTGKLGGLFGKDADLAAIEEQGRVLDDLNAGLERLRVSGKTFSEEFVVGLKGAFVAGRIDGKAAIDAFAAYEKQLTAMAKSNVETVRKVTEAEANEMARLVGQIKADQERRQIEQEKATLSATDFAIAQAEREAEKRREAANGNAGILEMIESELQIKLKAIRDQAVAERTAEEARVTSAVQSAADQRVGIEQSAARAVAAVWDQANAAKAARTGGAIMNQGTAGEFVSSWDANGNYVGDLGTTSSTPRGYAGGGEISGPGTSTSDSILARLSRGEFVIREASASRIGYGVLDFINRFGSLPKFASGGAVGINAGAQALSGISIGQIVLPGVENARQFVTELKSILRTHPNLLSTTNVRAG